MYFDCFECYISSPLPPDELANIIHEACGDDSSTAMLTQVNLHHIILQTTNNDSQSFCKQLFS